MQALPRWPASPPAETSASLALPACSLAGLSRLLACLASSAIAARLETRSVMACSHMLCSFNQCARCHCSRSVTITPAMHLCTQSLVLQLEHLTGQRCYFTRAFDASPWCFSATLNQN